MKVIRTTLKIWIAITAFSVSITLARIFYFLATHYGYGQNGVNTVWKEFLFQLKYPNDAVGFPSYPLFISSNEFYAVLFLIGIYVLSFAESEHVYKENSK